MKKITYERSANLGNFETTKVTVDGLVSDDATMEEYGAEYKKLESFVSKVLNFEIKKNKTIKRDPKGARE